MKSEKIDSRIKAFELSDAQFQEVVALAGIGIKLKSIGTAMGVYAVNLDDYCADQRVVEAYKRGINEAKKLIYDKRKQLGKKVTKTTKP